MIGIQQYGIDNANVQNNLQQFAARRFDKGSCELGNCNGNDNILQTRRRNSNMQGNIQQYGGDNRNIQQGVQQYARRDGGRLSDHFDICKYIVCPMV